MFGTLTIMTYMQHNLVKLLFLPTFFLITRIISGLFLLAVVLLSKYILYLCLQEILHITFSLVNNLLRRKLLLENEPSFLKILQRHYLQKENFVKLNSTPTHRPPVDQNNANNSTDWNLT